MNLSWLNFYSAADHSIICVAVGTVIASGGEEALESWKPADDEVVLWLALKVVVGDTQAAEEAEFQQFLSVVIYPSSTIGTN